MRTLVALARSFMIARGTAKRFFKFVPGVFVIFSLTVLFLFKKLDMPSIWTHLDKLHAASPQFFNFMYKATSEDILFLRQPLSAQITCVYVVCYFYWRLNTTSPNFFFQAMGLHRSGWWAWCNVVWGCFIFRCFARFAWAARKGNWTSLRRRSW